MTNARKRQFLSYFTHFCNQNITALINRNSETCLKKMTKIALALIEKVYTAKKLENILISLIKSKYYLSGTNFQEKCTFELAYIIKHRSQKYKLAQTKIVRFVFHFRTTSHQPTTVPLI